LSESVVLNHARRSVVPERLSDALLWFEPLSANGQSPSASGSLPSVFSQAALFNLTHLDDNLMTDQEIRELPKVWVIGGDGALGDIGFQNVSKVILQNRPNVKLLMLDTQ